MKDVDVGILIKQQLIKQNRSIEWLAKQVKCAPCTLRRQLARNCVKISLLTDISIAIDTDFFISGSQWLKMKKSCKNARTRDTEKKQNEIHIGQHIKVHVVMSSMSVTNFAEKINLSCRAVYNIFENKSINTELLHIISVVLDYNFFELYVSNDNQNEK